VQISVDVAARSVRTRRAMASLIALGLAALTGCSVDGPAAVVVTVTADPESPAASQSSVASPTSDATVAAVDVRVVEHAGNRYKVVTLPLDEWNLRVDWEQDPRGTSLDDVVVDPLVAVATNAGIFTPELSPGGLLVSDGVTLRELNLADGSGNFHLKPNGVFEVRDDGTAAVVDSTFYDSTGVTFATQSGPALVLAGAIHPEFVEGSTNLAYRSGVGVSPDGGTVYLALSWTLTNFYDFATLFTDELGCDDALYLDGNVSRLWVSSDGDPGPFSGPYAGVITARPSGT